MENSICSNFLQLHEKISNIIDETLYITDLQKRFYKTMLIERKKKILDFSLNKLNNV